MIFVANSANIEDVTNAHLPLGSNSRGIQHLRIAAPNDYGTSTVATVAAAFTRGFPACSVDLILSDSRADLIADHIDLSIRIGWLDDSSLQAKRVGTFRQFLVASADLAKSITAQEPEDLSALPFIANGALREPLVWHFTKGDFDRRVVSMRQSMSINATPAVLAAALAGGGLTVLPDFLIAEHFRTGRLVNLLPSGTLPSGGIHAVFPAARFRPPKGTTFVAMLVDQIRHSAGNLLTETK